MPTRQQLHELVDRLPESELATAHRVLAAFGADPHLYSLLTALEDDEPYTGEQRRQDAEALADPRPSIPHDQLMRELGIE